MREGLKWSESSEHWERFGELMLMCPLPLPAAEAAAKEGCKRGAQKEFAKRVSAGWGGNAKHFLGYGQTKHRLYLVLCTCDRSDWTCSILCRALGACRMWDPTSCSSLPTCWMRGTSDWRGSSNSTPTV